MSEFHPDFMRNNNSWGGQLLLYYLFDSTFEYHLDSLTPQTFTHRKQQELRSQSLMCDESQPKTGISAPTLGPVLILQPSCKVTVGSVIGILAAAAAVTWIVGVDSEDSGARRRRGLASRSREQCPVRNVLAARISSPCLRFKAYPALRQYPRASLGTHGPDRMARLICYVTGDSASTPRC